MLFKIKYVSKSAIIRYIFDLNLTNLTIFWSLEVVDRGNETQFQVAENLYLLAQELRLSKYWNNDSITYF